MFVWFLVGVTGFVQQRHAPFLLPRDGRFFVNSQSNISLRGLSRRQKKRDHCNS